MRKKRIYKTRSISYTHSNSPIKIKLWPIVTAVVVVLIIAINSIPKNNKGEEIQLDKSFTAEIKQSDGSSSTTNQYTDPHADKNTEKYSVQNFNPQPEVYRVTRVVDGDTIDVDISGAVKRVRLIGVNTPETVHPNQPQQCFGREASNFVKNLLNGKSVGLESDDSQDNVDKYGRLLRFVYLNGENINYKIIYDGYGYEYTYNVPYKYQADFRDAQRDASLNGRGLWSPTTCNGQR